MILGYGSFGGPQSHSKKMPIKRTAEPRVNPDGDVGLPRKIIVNTHGDTAPHGGGAIWRKLWSRHSGGVLRIQALL